MPPPSGNALIDGLMPLFRLVDHAAEAAPLIMWLAWAMTATVLAGLPILATRARSLLGAVLLIVPGTFVLLAALILFSMLLGDAVRVDPFLNLGAALAVHAGLVLAGWRFSSVAPRQMQAADFALRLARPVLVMSALVLAIALAPPRTLHVLPLLTGGAVFLVDVLLTRMLLDTLRRASTARSASDLLRFGCVAPVYVVPDGSLSFVAAAVGLTHGSSAVFVQQHIEDALNSSDPAAVRRATHVLAHEAGHVVQQHGLWRTLAAAGVATILPIVSSTNGVPALTFTIALLMVCAVAAFVAGEWAAERFAARMADPV